jgi:hypothetical protein
VEQPEQVPMQIDMAFAVFPDQIIVVPVDLPDFAVEESAQ